MVSPPPALWSGLTSLQKSNNPPRVQPKPSFTGVTSEGWVEACSLWRVDGMLLWGDGHVLLLSIWCSHLFDRSCHVTSCHHQGKRAHPGCCLGRSTATPLSLEIPCGFPHETMREAQLGEPEKRNLDRATFGDSPPMSVIGKVFFLCPPIAGGLKHKGVGFRGAQSTP
jgi:hypothetical protein